MPGTTAISAYFSEGCVSHEYEWDAAQMFDNRPKGRLGARKQQEGACVPQGGLNALHRITIASCNSASLTDCFI